SRHDRGKTRNGPPPARSPGAPGTGPGVYRGVRPGDGTEPGRRRTQPLRGGGLAGRRGRTAQGPGSGADPGGPGLPKAAPPARPHRLVPALRHQVAGRYSLLGRRLAVRLHSDRPGRPPLTGRAPFGTPSAPHSFTGTTPFPTLFPMETVR